MYGIYKELTKENILALVTPYEIFRHYIPWFEPGRTIRTPFKDEHHASFWSRVDNTGNIFFKDFGRGYDGDWCTLVMKLHNCNFQKALDWVNKEMRLGLGQVVSQAEEDIKWHMELLKHEKVHAKPTTRMCIQYDIREFSLLDYAYWASYGWSEHMITVYRIKAISAFYIEGYKYVADKFAYAWETVYGEVKIYQPFSEDMKWRSNTTNNWLQGESQLPRKGSLLLIQSSMKDIGCIASRYHIPGVAPNGEHGLIPKDKLSSLSNRFARIVILYDNDKEGIKAAQKMSGDTGFQMLILPRVSEETKDPSDFIYHGYYSTLNNFFKQNKLI